MSTHKNSERHHSVSQAFRQQQKASLTMFTYGLQLLMSNISHSSSNEHLEEGEVALLLPLSSGLLEDRSYVTA
jgi:hypothetical protein